MPRRAARIDSTAKDLTTLARSMGKKNEDQNMADVVPVPNHTETRDPRTLPVTAHTPGPWTVTCLKSPSRRAEFRVHERYDEQLRPEPKRVATIVMDDEDEGQANAALIKAAPDLLEACRAFLERYENRQKATLGFCYAEMKAAVDKAEGR